MADGDEWNDPASMSDAETAGAGFVPPSYVLVIVWTFTTAAAFMWLREYRLAVAMTAILAGFVAIYHGAIYLSSTPEADDD